MERKINTKALIISLVFALISCIVLFNYINSIKKPAPPVEKVKLLVAAENIESGTLITMDHIEAVDISADSIPDGIINDRAGIEDFYAKEPVMRGEPFRKERLASKEELSLSWNIPESMRAISIFVNEDGLFSTLLRTGDRVDVIGSFKTDMGQGLTIASSMIIVQNAEVLAIGPDRLGETTDQIVDDEKLPRTVTLAVSPSDAEKIAFATDFGDFSLILRANGDDNIVNTPGTLIEDVTPPRIRLFGNMAIGDQTNE